MDKPRRADDRGEADKRRLKELALEASRHLDFILPGGDGSETRKPRGSEHERSGEISRTSGKTGKGADPAEEVVQAPKRSGSRVSPASGGESAGSAKPAAGPSRFTGGALRAPGEATPNRLGREAAEAGRPSALVVHVSHGLARVLANLLTNMGVSTAIATNLEEARSIPTDGHWDLLFIQGTAMPHPGKDVAALVLDRFRQSPPPTILLARHGDALLAEASAFEAAGLLEWPFSPAKVEAVLTQVLPMTRARRD